MIVLCVCCCFIIFIFKPWPQNNKNCFLFYTHMKFRLLYFSCLSFALSCLGWIHTVSLFLDATLSIEQQKKILKYSQQHAPTTFSLLTAVIPFCLVYSKLFNFIYFFWKWKIAIVIILFFISFSPHRH